MALTQEQKATVAKAIVEKINDYDSRCPLCGHTDFSLSDGFTTFAVMDQPLLMLGVAGRGVPCVSLSCDHCGHMFFLNIFNLGLAEYFGVRPSITQTNG